jgi:glycosyltransferase involved in cell wall biosynthesis
MGKISVCMLGTSLPIPPRYGGGIETYVYELSKHLSRIGDEVTVISISPLRRASGVIKEGIRYEFFANKRVVSALPLVLILEIFKLCCKTDAQIYHYNLGLPTGYGSWLAAKLRGKPKVSTMHTPLTLLSRHSHGLNPQVAREQTRFPSSLIDYRHRPLETLINDINVASECIVAKLADHVISTSQAVKHGLTTFLKVDPNKITVIPPGVDVDRFNPTLNHFYIRRMLGIDDDPIILFVGRLIRSKGVHYLLQAVSEIKKEIPNVRIILVGPTRGFFQKPRVHLQDDYMTYLHKIVKEGGLEQHVFFEGNVPIEKLPYYYAACDVFALPSLHEGFGLSVVEAMACGKPVVVSNLGGLRDIVDDGISGFLIKPGDLSQLIDKLSYLLKNVDGAKSIGKVARKVVEEKFSGHIIAQRVHTVYEKVLELR